MVSGITWRADGSREARGEDILAPMRVFLPVSSAVPEGIVWSIRVLACTLLFLALPDGIAAAQAAASTTEVVADTAQIVARGRYIATLRSGLGALTAEDRAAAAVARIENALRDRTIDTVEIRRIPEGMLVTVGTRSLIDILRADVDTALGETLPEVTSAAADRLRELLRDDRRQRGIGQWIRGILLSIIATALFVVVLRGLRIGRRLLLARLPTIAEARLRGFSVRGFTFLTAEQLLAFVRRSIDLVAWGLGLFAAYLWLAFVLTRFAYSRPWGELLGDYLIRTIRDLALGAITAIPGLFTVVLIVIATRWIVRLVNAFFDAVESGDVAMPGVHEETAQPTRRIVTVLLWLFAVVVAWPYLPGSDSDVFRGVSVFIGVVISLGSTGVVNQGMSGLVLMYSRALKPGDYVRIADTEGVVTALGMLSTKIRTAKRVEITLPNAVVVGSNIKNFSRLRAEQGVIVTSTLTIGYDTPWRQVHALLLEAAARTGGVQVSPPPFVHQTRLSDFYIEYELNVYLEIPESRITVLSELHGHIVDTFNEYGVQITSPHYVVDPPRPKIVPPEDWYAPPARGGE